jgi:hypothetical protein
MTVPGTTVRREPVPGIVQVADAETAVDRALNPDSGALIEVARGSAGLVAVVMVMPVPASVAS